MASKKDIDDYALTLMVAFGNRDGLRLYYKLTKITVQDFTQNEWFYFEWLLQAIPKGLRDKVVRRIAKLKPNVSENMKTRLGIHQSSIPFSVVHNAQKLPAEEVAPLESNMEIVSEILLEQDGVGPSRSEPGADERKRVF